MGYPRGSRFQYHVYIFCTSGYELEFSWDLPNLKGVLPEADAMLCISYNGKEGKKVLSDERATHENHEELAFMLKFLLLFAEMWCHDERYFEELCKLEKRIISVEKKYASLK
jgi:hypothetical protein